MDAHMPDTTQQEGQGGHVWERIAQALERIANALETQGVEAEDEPPEGDGYGGL